MTGKRVLLLVLTGVLAAGVIIAALKLHARSTASESVRALFSEGGEGVSIAALETAESAKLRHLEALQESLRLEDTPETRAEIAEVEKSLAEIRAKMETARNEER